MKLTLPQQDIYFEQLLFPNEPVYNIGAKIEIKGQVNIEIFKRAYVALIDQHDAYRSIIVKKEENLKKEIDIICTLPGVGELTAVIVLAETNGFELIRNKRQLASYAGLDVKEKQSGTSVKGKPRISKKGNRNLRKAMHFPALVAVKWNDNFRELYARLVSKHGIKMKALVAVQRKLLEMIFILFKNQTSYNKEYEKQKNSVQTQMV